MRLSNRDTYIWLNSLGMSSRTINNIEIEIGDINQIFTMSKREILDLEKIKDPTKNKIIKNRDYEIVEKFISELDNREFKILTIIDEDYPERLKEIYDPPKVLYYKGKNVLNNHSIAVVGARKMTDYGRWVTEKLVGELCKIGVTIVSGLASGIDGIAHRTTLNCEGCTIGVLGNGIDIIYPETNIGLYKNIPKDGVVITEFPLGTEPKPFNFPLRNRIISGLSLAVLVVEAKERSGSLITAYQALEQGREVFSIPGNINSIYSRGCNRLIQDGAKMVLDIDDIIEEINELKNLKYSKKAEKFKDIDLSELELKIFKEIKQRPISCDEIVIKTGINISTVNSILTILEIKGLIEEMSGRVFTLS